MISVSLVLVSKQRTGSGELLDQRPSRSNCWFPYPYRTAHIPIRRIGTFSSSRGLDPEIGDPPLPPFWGFGGSPLFGDFVVPQFGDFVVLPIWGDLVVSHPGDFVVLNLGVFWAPHNLVIFDPPLPPLPPQIPPFWGIPSFAFPVTSPRGIIPPFGTPKKCHFGGGSKMT